jgi:hypothetical protein
MISRLLIISKPQSVVVELLMKEKLYAIKRNSAGFETDKSFRVSKRTLLNEEKRHPESMG